MKHVKIKVELSKKNANTAKITLIAQSHYGGSFGREFPNEGSRDTWRPYGHIAFVSKGACLVSHPWGNFGLGIGVRRWLLLPCTEGKEVTATIPASDWPWIRQLIKDYNEWGGGRS